MSQQLLCKIFDTADQYMYDVCISMNQSSGHTFFSTFKYEHTTKKKISATIQDF